MFGGYEATIFDWVLGEKIVGNRKLSSDGCWYKFIF